MSALPGTSDTGTGMYGNGRHAWRREETKTLSSSDVAARYRLLEYICCITLRRCGSSTYRTIYLAALGVFRCGQG